MAIPRPAAHKIPGLVPGIFFLTLALAPAAPPPPPPDLALAAELFAEGQWAAARTEAHRAQALATGPAADHARLLAATCTLRLNDAPAAAKDDLAALWQNPAAPRELRCQAAYELALADWHSPVSRTPAALEFAYLHTQTAPLFWRAGCSLYFYLKAHKTLRHEKAPLWQSLQTCRDAWPLEIWRECRPRRPRGPPLAARPAHWLVRFYRTHIGPAIGSRCDLQPSCSEYFRQATQTHGLLGFPIMADRFIRESSVVADKAQPLTMPDGRIRYADPLTDHTFWLRGPP